VDAPTFIAQTAATEATLPRLVPMCSSSEFQLHREAAILELPAGHSRDGYVRSRLVTRKKEEEARAKKREAIADRRRMIQEGNLDPLDYMTAAQIHGLEKRPGRGRDPMLSGVDS
jgi:hypothetical protein